MPDQPEPACLVLADISGYTSYLAGVELDHAQDILADLTDAVVRALRPTFRLAKLEGDAAFAYVVTDVIDGSILQDTIEHCYIAFRRRLRDIGQASQCDCNACTYIPRLDLKFVVHHGLIARQRMAGREELVGRDVIVVHRLLKNNVQAELGIGAYALYTDECVRIMGLADPAGAGLIEHRETYDIVGEVTGWVRDLEAVWQEAEASSALVVGAAQAAWTHRSPSRDRRRSSGSGSRPRLAASSGRSASTPSTRTSPVGGAGSGRRTTAFTAATRSSRRSSPGIRPKS